MALDPPLSINRCPDFPDLIEKPSFSQNEFRHGTPTPRDGNNCRNLKLNPDLKSSANVEISKNFEDAGASDSENSHADVTFHVSEESLVEEIQENHENQGRCPPISQNMAETNNDLREHSYMTAGFWVGRSSCI